MGILTRRQGELFVISSDQTEPGLANKRPPRRVNDAYLVWTGDRWSTEPGEAILFASLDEADEYVRANYGKVST